ncbi:hypothetical protein ANN_01386 [Periplaneta americana]|uniref:Uncharacterized protein n=1 Tax=Periplaneta americana TaxID=6978 RepID=A0ABQ8TTF7_PERAM|nr:hypothetical protein ANN_01386 [Periplaneta americana]
MAGLCEGGNEPSGSLKASNKQTTTTVDTTIHVQWPTRSPDLSPLDFFLWGTVKDSVYQNILQHQTTYSNALDRLVCPFNQQHAGQSYGLSGNAFECALM